MESKTPRNIIQIDEDLVQSQLKEVVKDTVEETLNAMLNAEDDRTLFLKTGIRIYYLFAIIEY